MRCCACAECCDLTGECGAILIRPGISAAPPHSRVTAQPDRLQALTRIIQKGDAVLFTGAGFSAEARDGAGNCLPDSKAMIAELWSMLFPDEEPDESTLADLYDVALLRAPDRLRVYLQTRLQIGDTALPRSFATWFGAPWHRIYTLNVDNLECAVARQFELPRPLVSLSALAKEIPRASKHVLEVVHLNGIASDDPADVTFSTMQYAARLCEADRAYERLVDDLRTRPFVFVGTTLDEVVLWKHVQLERQANGGNAARHSSFLISPSLTKARQTLLAANGIQWVEATAAEVAEKVLAPLERAA